MNLLPERLSTDILALKPGEERYTVSIVFHAGPDGRIIDDETWIGKSLVKSTGLLSWDDINAVIYGQGSTLKSAITGHIKGLNVSDISLFSIPLF